MLDTDVISVVILYAHPLLGEGLARLLAVEPGLAIVAVSITELDRAEAALGRGVDVVIVERGDRPAAADLIKLAPSALVIELGLGSEPTFTYRREEISGQPEGIVGAIRAFRDSGRAVVAAAAGT